MPSLSLFLTLVAHIDIRQAIGASLISVIATSSGSALAYLRERLTNIRIAMFLEIATTLGALTGAMIGSSIKSNTLFLLFGIVLLYSTSRMFRTLKEEIPRGVENGHLSELLRLRGSYYDTALGKEVRYQVTEVGQVSSPF